MPDRTVSPAALAISAKLVANLITAPARPGAHVDLHAARSRVLRHSTEICSPRRPWCATSRAGISDNVMWCRPTSRRGARARARNGSTPVAIVDKRAARGRIEVMNIIGECAAQLRAARRHRRFGGTLCNAADALLAKAQPASPPTSPMVCCRRRGVAHCSSRLTELVLTDTILPTERCASPQHPRHLDVRTDRRSHRAYRQGRSVSSLFD